MARAYFSVASFNVRNLVLPDIVYYGGSKYSAERYRAKQTWLAEQLYRMDADIVCLQEVFHQEALADLAALYAELLAARDPGAAEAKRYANAVFAPNADARPDRPLPGLAILSRNPVETQIVIQDIAPDPIALDPADGLSYRLTRLSRPVMAAKIALGAGVSGWVFNAHLKSKRPKYPEDDPAADKDNADFLGRAYGVFRSLALRAGEALALRREILARMRGSSEPVIVVGDLNDEIGAVTTEIVGGEVPWRAWPLDLKKIYWDVELYSAARIHLRRTEHASLHTHIYNGHYGTIDHILVSQEFYFRNRDRIGDVLFVQSLNDHLTDDSVWGAPQLGDASDHGQLVARFSVEGPDTE